LGISLAAKTFALYEFVVAGTRSNRVHPWNIEFFSTSCECQRKSLIRVTLTLDINASPDGFPLCCAQPNQGLEHFRIFRFVHSARCYLEGNIIIHVIETTSWTRRWCLALGLWRALGLWSLTSIITTAQHLHIGGNDVGGVVGNAIFLVLPVLDATFNEKRLALLDVLAADLGQTLKENNAVPLGFLYDLSSLSVLAPTGGCQADIGYCLAGWEVADFGVFARISDQGDFVY
jgi:hypothetical protein